MPGDGQPCQAFTRPRHVGLNSHRRIDRGWECRYNSVEFRRTYPRKGNSHNDRHTCSRQAEEANVTPSNPYAAGLEKTPANFVALSPLTFLERAAAVYPQQVAIVHGECRQTWAETYTRCRRLASALQRRGIGTGDTVSALGYNTPETFELHFGVPMSGAVLNALNTRLDAATIAFMLEHSEAKLLITDTEAAPIIRAALDLLRQAGKSILVVDVVDPLGAGRRTAGRHHLRGTAGRRRPGVCLAAARRRMVADHVELHFGDDGQSQGRGLPPPRRLPERGQQRAGLGAAETRRLSLDAADVSLQRLVFSLDDGGGGGHQRLPAPCGRQPDL